MCKFPQPFLTIALLCSMQIVGRSQTNLIVVGKHSAHATRILARYVDAAAPQTSRAVLNSLGLHVVRQSRLIRGLVLLDDGADAGGGHLGLESTAPSTSLLQRIQTLRATGLFAYVQPDYVHTAVLAPNDFRVLDGTLWGLRNTGANGGIP